MRSRCIASPAGAAPLPRKSAPAQPLRKCLILFLTRWWFGFFIESFDELLAVFRLFILKRNQLQFLFYNDEWKWNVPSNYIMNLFGLYNYSQYEYILLDLLNRCNRLLAVQSQLFYLLNKTSLSYFTLM